MKKALILSGIIIAVVIVVDEAVRLVYGFNRY